MKRYHSSFVIGSDNYTLLMDTGDGISKALVSHGISFNEINGIIVSHLHPDHFSGLASILVQMKLNNRSNGLDIFIHQQLVEFVKKYIMQSYIFIERMGFDINFRVFADKEKTYIADTFNFYAEQNTHLEKYRPFDSEKLIKFSCSSFLFEEEGITFFYTGDIGDEKDLYLFDDRKISLMISEVSHVPYEKILLAFESMNVEKMILTHIDDALEETIRAFFLNGGKKTGKEITVAYDGLSIDLQRLKTR